MIRNPLPGDSQPDEPGLTGALVISSITVPNAGQMGLTHCPGRRQVDAQQRHWRRLLSEDLTAISQWGAQGVVSLLESHEFSRLGVADFPDKMTAGELRWFHLPIPDMHPPGESFTLGWHQHGREIFEILSRGDRLIIHCAAGLGRSGMIAAKILTAYGMQPAAAISLVRSCRPGAIETDGQAQYVLSGPPLADAGEGPRSK